MCKTAVNAWLPAYHVEHIFLLLTVLLSIPHIQMKGFDFLFWRQQSARTKLFSRQDAASTLRRPPCLRLRVSLSSNYQFPKWHEKQKRCNRDAIEMQPIDLRGYRYQIFLLHSDAKGCVSWCRNLKQRDAKSTALLDYIENQVPDAPTFFLPHLHSFYLQKWFLSQFAFVVFPHNFCQLLSHTQKTRYWHGGFSKK